MQLLLDKGKINQEDYNALKEQQGDLIKYIFDNLSKAFSSVRIGKAEFLKISSFLNEKE